MSKFCERLRELRQEHELTQNKVGSILKYQYSAISNYESGRNEPSIKDLIILAEFFDVSLDYLMGVTNERQRYLNNQSISQEEMYRKLIDNLYDIVLVELQEQLQKSKEKHKEEILQQLRKEYINTKVSSNVVSSGEAK